MSKPVLFSAMFVATTIAITAAAPPTRALCVNQDGSFQITRDTVRDDENFVSSSPASADSDFKLELNLGSFNGSPSTPEAATEADTAMTEVDPAEDDAMAEQNADEDTVVSLDELEASDRAPRPEDFEAVDISNLPIESREDYLNAIAEDLNRCP